MFDGPGIRMVLFLQGCPLRCRYCHNPETWDPKKGKEYETKEIIELILKYKNYFGSDGGVTLSGGEPLLQAESLIPLCKKLKANNINIALDTSGVGDRSFYKELLKYIDLVILDIKAIDNESYEKLTGSKIEASLEFLDEAQKQEKKLWIRSVIVPNINDNEDYINKLIIFLMNVKNIEKVELLPYHTLGVNKYKTLGIKYSLDGVKPMDKDIVAIYQNKINNILNLKKED